jgi:hypothetical protein
MFQVHPLGMVALTTVLLCWCLSVLLFRTGLPGSVGRRLAVLLLLEGMTLGSSTSGMGYWFVSLDATLSQHPWLNRLLTVVHFSGDSAMLALYPPFLAMALQTRLTRPFGNLQVQAVLAVAAATLCALAIFAPPRFGEAILYLAMASVFFFALAASINAWYLSTGTGRTRALIFALAFGFRDVCWTFVYSAALLPIWFVGLVTPQRLGVPFWDLHSLVYICGTLVAVPLIAYGILRTQLFDIDLRIRWTIKQTTVAAALVSVVFLVSEGVSQFLSAELGNVAGLLAAAVVMFFLAPLQRFAERVASAAMPSTENTPEYATFRKMLVYQTAVVEARGGGGISAKERSLLNKLRDSLGISASDAAAIERELERAAENPEGTGLRDGTAQA